MVVLSKETGVCAEHAVCKAKRRSAGLSRLCVETRVEHPGVRVAMPESAKQCRPCTAEVGVMNTL